MDAEERFQMEWMDLTPPVDPPEDLSPTFAQVVEWVGRQFSLAGREARTMNDHMAKLDKAVFARLGLPNPYLRHVHVHIPRMSGLHFTWTTVDEFYSRYMSRIPTSMKPDRVIRSTRHNCFGKKKADRVDVDFVMGLPVTYSTELKLKSIPVPTLPSKALHLHTKPLTEQRRR